MTLSKTDIQQRLNDNLDIQREEGSLSIEPSSVDLHLGSEVKKPTQKKGVVAVDDESSYPSYESYSGERFTIPSKGFALAHTEEVVDLPNDIVGFIWGRSSVGRLGLFIHNAGLIDAGFSGDIVLELTNASPHPIELRSGMRICQLTLHEHDSVPSMGYSAENGNKYQHQRGATPSRLYEDFAKVEADD